MNFATFGIIHFDQVFSLFWIQLLQVDTISSDAVKENGPLENRRRGRREEGSSASTASDVVVAASAAAIETSLGTRAAIGDDLAATRQVGEWIQNTGRPMSS